MSSNWEKTVRYKVFLICTAVIAKDGHVGKLTEELLDWLRQNPTEPAKTARERAANVVANDREQDSTKSTG